MKKGSKQRVTLVIIAGCAGAGKTTLGKKIASKLHYVYVDKDTVTRQYTDYVLCANGSTEGDRESPFYCNILREIEYQVTFKLCRENLDLGNSVVVTIPLIAAIGDQQAFSACVDLIALQQTGVVVKLIWIAHDAELELGRLRRRNAARDRHKLENWLQYCDDMRNIAPDPALGAYIFYNETDRNFEEETEKAIKWLQK